MRTFLFRLAAFWRWFVSGAPDEKGAPLVLFDHLYGGYRATIMVITLDLKPFGLVPIEIWGALVDGEPRVYAQVQDNPLAPLVSCPAKEATAFSMAIQSAAAAANRAAVSRAGS